MGYKTQKSVIKLNTSKIDHMFYWKCKKHANRDGFWSRNREKCSWHSWIRAS